MTEEKPEQRKPSFRKRLYEIIFEADTPAGKAFDVALLILIAASVLVVMLESINYIQIRYGELFRQLEWGFTILFTVEYLFRLYATKKPLAYAKSFYGVIDLLAILPTYLSLFALGYQQLIIIRALRLIRIFRIFKLGHFLQESSVIVNSLKASRAKITVFLLFVLLLVLIIGSVMYVVEGGTNSNFSSIPKAIYWAVVTLTTVGYGDITPVTGLGQFLSAAVMILGYAIIAVPTGIVSAEMVFQIQKKQHTTQVCPHCVREGHDIDAVFCKYCGGKLEA